MNSRYIFLWALWMIVGVIDLTKDKISKLDYFLVWILLLVQLMARALGV